MNFATPTYAVFIAVVAVLYWLLPQRRAQHVLLLVASYVFYAWWDARFASLLLLSTAVDFVAGARVAATPDARERQRWLWLSLIANLGILGFFKYCNFFVDSVVSGTAMLGMALPRPTLEIVLPVGISFFTFQSMSYTFDIYYGRLRPTRDLVQFGLYVAFFPQLVAGPIVRAREFLPQLETRRVPDAARWQQGLERILAGLVKKVVIADSLAAFCDPVFAAPGLHSSVEAWIVLVAFYGQIYCDFSGYTDIAIGSARLLGFHFNENFDRPYLARTPQEFWRRWHISLSTWLRDYLYIPLGGNRAGVRRFRRNLMATMLLGGLWHGAAWHFVLWGAWHGLWLVVYHARRRATDPDGARRLLGWAGTQAMVCVSWAFFRAPDSERLWELGKTLLRQDFAVSPAALEAVGLCALVVAAESARPLWGRLARRPMLDLVLRPAVYVTCIYAMLAFGRFDAQAFIYFQF